MGQTLDLEARFRQVAAQLQPRAEREHHENAVVPRWMQTETAARYCDFPNGEALRKAAAKDRIYARRIGRRLRYDRFDLDAWMAHGSQGRRRSA